MGVNTRINWADSSWNPWIGCSKCSPGCTNCYAAEWDHRNMMKDGNHWGPDAQRRITAETGWDVPLAWNRTCQKQGARRKVFGGDLCDWCDEEAPEGVLDWFWELIRSTPNLDWMLLTKRAERIAELLPKDWGAGYRNVWLGVTVENREQGLPRIDVLREIPAKCRFLSIEPLLEDLGEIDMTGITWAIVGGESGDKARVFRAEWAESIMRQCREQGTALWVKQLGAKPEYLGEPIRLVDGHGENWAEWPTSLEHLKAREFPLVEDEEATANQADQHESRLKWIEAALEKLATDLDPQTAETEQSLRESYLKVERGIFQTRREKAAILAHYKVIYGPLRKWSEFTKIIGMSRRTSYALLELADPSHAQAGDSDCAENAQSDEDTGLTYQFDQIVDKAVRKLSNLLKPLGGEQRQDALDLIYERVLESEPASFRKVA